MIVSLYRDKNTWLHRLDPRTKLIGVAMIFALCLCFNHPLYMAPVTGGVLLLLVFSRSLSVLWTLRNIFVLLVLFSVLLWPLFVKGPTGLYRWQFVEVSRESLLYGVAMGLRLSTFVMGGLLLLATTRHEEMSGGFIRMGLPYPMAFALTTALRLVPTFAGAGAMIIQAQVSRGLDLESKGLLARVRTFLPLAVPMFDCAIRYTNLLSMALESRGFSPGAPRTLYHEPRMMKKDWLSLLGLAICLVSFLYVRLVLHWGAVIPGRM